MIEIRNKFINPSELCEGSDPLPEVSRVVRRRDVFRVWKLDNIVRVHGEFISEGHPGDYLVCNIETTEYRVYTPEQFNNMFEEIR